MTFYQFFSSKKELGTIDLLNNCSPVGNSFGDF